MFLILTSSGFSSRSWRLDAIPAVRLIWPHLSNWLLPLLPIQLPSSAMALLLPTAFLLLWLHSDVRFQSQPALEDDVRPGSLFKWELFCHALLVDCGLFLSLLSLLVQLFLVSLLNWFWSWLQPYSWILPIPHLLDGWSGNSCSTPGSGPCLCSWLLSHLILWPDTFWLISSWWPSSLFLTTTLLVCHHYCHQSLTILGTIQFA